MDIIVGGKGNDLLIGSEENDQILGGDGNDTLHGLAGEDTLYGEKGNDLLRGGNDNDRLWGGDGNDILVGDKGSDVFEGGNGNDIMVWNDGDGSDIMRGGAGYDTTVFNGSVALGDEITLQANGGRAIFQRVNLVPITLDVDDTEQFAINGLGGDETFTVKDLSGTDVQKVIFNGNDGNDRLDASQTNVNIIADGGAGHDTLVGGKASDFLRGGNDNDHLSGNHGNDILVGDKGSDVFEGGSGNDRMIWNDGDGSDIMRGGAGYDTTVFNGSVALGDEITLQANGGRAIFQRVNLVPITLDVDDTEQFEINGLGGDETFTVKSLAGTDVQKVIFNGNDGNDRLDASQTNVNIVADGGKGNDTLIGGTNNDTLIGGEGSDLLTGGGGNDVLVGGSVTGGSIDTFNGGNGSDRYVLASANSVFYNDGNNSTAGLNDYALIQGFNTSQDKIQLEGSASRYVLGSSPINGVGGTGIYLDTNGNGTLGSSDELISVVAGVTNLTLSAGYFSYV
jgi:Ca2+-binding RTX toxin-like protein